MLYLDHNATTPPSPAVRSAVERALTECWANPSSVHRAGQAAKYEVELARASIAELIGAKSRDITFTSGGTEALDLAIRGVLAANPGKVLVTTKVEHSAVRELAEELEKSTPNLVKWCPIDHNGVVDLVALDAMIDSSIGLVCVQWANNETGVIQPVERIAEICRAKGVLFCCDGTQWIGKMPCSAPPADVMAFAPHKFHGPKGVGVLFASGGVRLRPRLIGSQELGRRAGTENVPGIMGAGVAAREALEWLGDAADRERLRDKRDQFELEVVRLIPEVVIHGKSAARLWNTTNIGVPKLEAEALLILLSERGVCASAGAACSSGSLEPSPVLLAMGIDPVIAHGSIRFSLSRHTTERELAEAAEIFAECVRIARRSI